MLPNYEELVGENNFEIELGDHTLPNFEKRVESLVKPSLEPVSPLDQSFKDLQNYLTEAVDGHFSRSKSILNAVTLKESIEAYAKILEILNTHRADWQTFCRSIIVIQRVGPANGGEFEPLFEGELNAWQSEILNGVKLGGAIHSSQVTAELASRPLGEFKSSLHHEFLQLKKQFVTEMLDMLIQLVGLEALGLVQWFGKEACTYSSYVRTCDFEKIGERTAGRSLYSEDGGLKQRDTVEIQFEGKRTLVRRIQHLVEATECKVGETKFAVPREQLEFLKTIPACLSSAIRIVEGVLIRETMVEKDLGVKSFSAVEDRVQWHSDPAITLGPFVLSAWGETEILKEEERQKTAENVAEVETDDLKSRRWPWNKVTGFALIVVASLIIQTQPANRASVFVGFAIGWIAAVLLGTRFSVNSNQSVAAAEDNNPDRSTAFYAVCGATIMLISTLFNAHGYYWLSLPIAVISSVFWVLYIRLHFRRTCIADGLMSTD